MTLDNIVSIAGAIVPILSAISSFLNHIVRTTKANGEKPAPALLATGAIVNAGAVNIDKAIELAKMLRKK